MYDTYKHLLGQPYTSGDKDCYGLAMDYYKDVYQLSLTNVARPEQWWNDPRMNIITDLIDIDDWEDVGCNLRNLKRGDALVFSLISSKANHIGIYVGNGLFIHHVYLRQSNEEALTAKWTSRCLAVLRHPKVTIANDKLLKTVDYMELRNATK